MRIQQSCIDRLLKLLLWHDCICVRCLLVHFDGHQQCLTIIDVAWDGIWTSQVVQVCRVHEVRIQQSGNDRLIELLFWHDFICVSYV